MPNLLDRITINPGQYGARPCIREMRIRVSVSRSARGWSFMEQVLEDLPDLEPDNLTAALQYASRRLDHPVLAA